MPINARFTHVNIVAQDWQALAQFYEQVLGCVPIPPERDLAGEWLERATAVPGAHLRGVHLQLPGFGDGGLQSRGIAGPTLEIFQYHEHEDRPPTAVNRPGLGHVAFAVDDVEAAREAVLAAGGGYVGQVVSLEVPGAGTVTFVYLTDPEGNILELQKWS
jgi:catechol 2,3-dioxygenase-like lactoylglutathione lyase family enzyme